MDNNTKKDLHQRYLKRQLSPEELKTFFVMLEQGSAEDLADLDEVANTYPTLLAPQENLAQKILNQQRTKKTSRLFIQRSAAAVIALMILFGSYQTFQYYSFIQKTKTFTIVKVPVGKMTTLDLEDGTQIVLNSGTVFKYPLAFTKAERRVYLLEGQAYFKVAHDKTKPFRVNSGKLSTTALGTSFIIKRYQNYHYEKVSLFTGKVRIEENGSKGRKVFLNPGQEYDYHNGNAGPISGFDNSANPISPETLSFKRIPFRDAIYSISSFYGVKIRFDEAAFKDFSISGNFNSIPVSELLQSLTFIYPFKISKTDSTTYKLTRIEKKN